MANWNFIGNFSFEIKIKLVTGLSNLKKLYFCIAVGYGLGISLFSKITENYSTQLKDLF